MQGYPWNPQINPPVGADREAASVQELQALTNAVVRIGERAIIASTGSVWVAVDRSASGSVWRPATGFWNCRDFGVTLDNVTDDFQAASDWLGAMDVFNAAVGGGCTGLLDAGDLRTSGTLVIGGETTIMGLGKLVSRIRGNLAGPLLRAQNVAQPVVKDLGVENQTRGTAGGIGLEFDAVREGKIENLDVRQVETMILIGNASLNCNIRDVWATSGVDGIVASGASNACQIYGARVNNCTRYNFYLSEVSQCNIGASAAEGIPAGGTGYRVDVGGSDAISNTIEGCRAESSVGAGVGIEIDAGVQYTNLVFNYLTGLGATPIIDNGIGTYEINRGRNARGVLLAENVFQAPGETLARARYLQAAGGDPEIWEILQESIAGVLANPVLARRYTAHIQAGSSNGVTGGDPHYLSFVDTTGSGSSGSLRAQTRAPNAGRCVNVTLFSGGNLGSTEVRLLVNGGVVATDTQTVGAGGSATFVLSASTGDQHWSAGDILTLGFVPTNSPTNPVVIAQAEMEFDRRP